MAETPKHAAGTFCWVELASSDQGAARSFYSALFGWEAEEVQMSEDSTYTMFHNGGRYTAALYHADPKQPNAGPDCWGAYVAVDSVDEASVLQDPAGAAKSFYGGLFGWTAHEQEMPPPTGISTSFMLGESPAGGMMQIQPAWGEVPPHWATYFSVDDCGETVAMAVELGPTTIAPTVDIPGVGRFARLADPMGATFAVITLVER